VAFVSACPGDRVLARGIGVSAVDGRARNRQYPSAVALLQTHLNQIPIYLPESFRSRARAVGNGRRAVSRVG